MSCAKPRLSSVVLPLILLLSPAAGQASATPDGEAQPAAVAALFSFHSNFWVNLHQVLLHEARLQVGKPDRPVESTPPLSAPGMSKEDQAAWDAAVSFYATHFGTRRQHGDDELIDINEALAAQPDAGAPLNPAGLPAEVVPVLQSAALVYRKYWWPAESAVNEAWLASQQQRVQDIGPRLAAAMTKDLHQPWPKVPIRVDVCYYVAELGHAFTITDPPHTTFSSSGPSTQGLSGFELLFHESSHTYADTLMNALAAEGGKQHKDVGDLWHATLFYTSGVELRRLLPASEQAGFTPYAYQYDVYRGRWLPYRHVLETDWQAYLDGKTSFDAAIHGMVADLQP
jgi:hypothetical protein